MSDDEASEMVDAASAADQWQRSVLKAISKRSEWWTAKGVNAGVREKPWPLSRKLLPRDITTEELASIEPAVYWAQERMEQCAQCPPHGGACDVDFDMKAEKGKLPSWNEQKRDIDFVWCARHIEHLLRQRLRYAGVPEVLLGAAFENFTVNDALRDELEQYVLHFDPSRPAPVQSYHLIGNVGTGKSHAAAAIVRALLKRRVVSSVFFAFVPTLLDTMRDNFDRSVDERDAFRARITTCDLLVLDDLGAERATDWVREQLGVILHERWANNRHVMLTSNKTLEEYRGSLLTDRAYSRLKALVPFVRRIDGKDRRAP